MKYLKEIAMNVFFGLICWVVTVGFVKLITLCFGWSFTWPAATGVWLALLLVRWYMVPTKE